jgi:hypothetical protein
MDRAASSSDHHPKIQKRKWERNPYGNPKERVQNSRWRFPTSTEIEMRIDRSLRELYDAADAGDALLIAAHAGDALDSWQKLNMETRMRLRTESIFRSLPVIEHLSHTVGLAIFTAWATLQAITQQYRLTDRETGEIVTLEVLSDEDRGQENAIRAMVVQALEAERES